MHKSTRMTFALLCGMLDCLCFGGGDWLMIYGDTTHSGSLYWLTEGVAQIVPWRNMLAMALSFPGIILYGVALFSIERWIPEKRTAASTVIASGFDDAHVGEVRFGAARANVSPTSAR